MVNCFGSGLDSNFYFFMKDGEGFFTSVFWATFITLVIYGVMWFFTPLHSHLEGCC